MLKKVRISVLLIMIFILMVSCRKEKVWEVTFETNGGSEVYSIIVENLETIPNVISPTKEGYTFNGWYLDENFIEKADLNDLVVDKNLTLYAKWTPNVNEEIKWNVTFNTNGGTKIESVEVENNNKLPQIANPYKEGYTFDGWYLDENFTEKVDLNNLVVDKNLTLHAKWIENVIEEIKWNVTFNTNGGTKIESVEVENNNKLPEIANPYKEGYTFDGWYLDENFVEKADLNNLVVDKNLTLYAKWTQNIIEEIKWNVTFNTNGGTVIESVEVENNSKLPQIANPYKEGYTFEGWYLDGEYQEEVDIKEYEVISDITLYAKWLKEEELILGDIEVIEYSGYFESAYLKWKPAQNADSYNVFYRNINDSSNNYTKLDMRLIREYENYFRADVLGLAKGTYEIKVVPILNGEEGNSSKVIVNVTNYDRSGFAFSSDSQYKTASGAYNDDGTLKSNAQVIYVTKNNAKTVTATVNGTTHTGLQTILDAKQKANTSNDVLCIRIIGMITLNDLDHISSSAEGLQIKGKSAYTNMNITFEGVGDDATIYGFGFLVRNSSNVEFRNFAIMAYIDDGISLDTNNSNIWIHNLDLFYGSTGGDSDQTKGDGSIDIKGTSTYITISYVNFVDSGKASLCGMSESKEFMVTYHHNWFNHSDSRHPRIRLGSIHVYNNYFDGNSKYGVGVTMGSSAFVEANYFDSCKYPMMSSKQGTDALGDGTFSGENGGMIKAYNNIINNASSLIYSYENDSSFDAYLASTRDELVPDTLKTIAGSTIYNNFDTSYDLGVDEKNIDKPEDVPTIVKEFAGRMNGGDFKWEFSDEDKLSYDVDKELKSKILSYKSSLIRVLGENIKEDNNEGNNDDTTDVPDDTPIVTTNVYHSFTESGKVSDFFEINGNTSTSKGKVYYSNLELSTCLKIESSTSIKFTTSKTMTLTLVFGGTTDASGKNIKINGTKYKIENNLLIIELEAGDYEITKGDSINLFYIELE